MGYPVAQWEYDTAKRAYVLRCPHCGRGILIFLGDWPVTDESWVVFQGPIYHDKYHDGFYSKAPHDKQRLRTFRRRIERPPTPAFVVESPSFPGLGSFAGERDRYHELSPSVRDDGSVFPGVTAHLVIYRAIRRVKCGDCDGIMEVPH